MNFVDPFYGYSLLLRAIVYGLVPAFMVLQFFRLRRALHVFQLEGYKRARFLAWCRANPRRALFMSSAPAKKPLVMTGRAWRILAVALLLTLIAVLVLPGLAHLYAGGWPADLATWAVMTLIAFVAAPYVLVASDLVLTPLQRAINARYLRSARAALARVSPTVIAVTGSFGKTSTKFAIAALVAPPDEVLATPGSFNTPLGVSRTINERLSAGHRFFVVEMGAYRRGDIAELASFVRPSVGVLTAVGPAHLERFGSIEAIEAAKYELIEALAPDGVAVMNVDDERVRALADRTAHVHVVRYGLDAANRPDLTATGVRFGPTGTEMTIVEASSGEQFDSHTRLLGRHAVGHVLAAVAVARAVGAEWDEIATRLPQLRPVEHRLQLIEGAGGVTVIDDAYNSNPQGAAAALEVLAQLPARRRIVVTPGIVELGALQYAENEEFGRRAAQVADVLVAVAPLNRAALVSGAGSAGSCEVVVVDSLAEAQQRLPSLVSAGDVVLFENDLPDQYEGAS